MGNSMSCLCRRREDERGEEIGMEELNRGEGILSDDESHYEEIKEDSSASYIPIYDLPSSLNNKRPETLRLRIMAEHHYYTNMEHRLFYDSTIDLNPNSKIEKMECLIHISVFNSRRRRIMDITYINDLQSNAMRHVMYWKNRDQDSWTLNYTAENDSRAFKVAQIRPVKGIFVWATTTHTKKNSEIKKLLFLSKKPTPIIVPSRIKDSLGCVVHISVYSLQMKAICDLILVVAKNQRSHTECFVQWKGPNMERHIQCSFSDPYEAGSF